MHLPRHCTRLTYFGSMVPPVILKATCTWSLSMPDSTNACQRLRMLVLDGEAHQAYQKVTMCWETQKRVHADGGQAEPDNLHQDAAACRFKFHSKSSACIQLQIAWHLNSIRCHVLLSEDDPRVILFVTLCLCLSSKSSILTDCVHNNKVGLPRMSLRKHKHDSQHARYTARKELLNLIRVSTLVPHVSAE